MKTIDHRADSWFVIDCVSLNQTWPEGPADVHHVCLDQYQPGLFLTEQYDLLNLLSAWDQQIPKAEVLEMEKVGALHP